jgi:hypothetical protein
VVDEFNDVEESNEEVKVVEETRDNESGGVFWDKSVDNTGMSTLA